MIQFGVEGFIGNQPAEMDAFDQGLDAYGVDSDGPAAVRSAPDCPRHR